MINTLILSTIGLSASAQAVTISFEQGGNANFETSNSVSFLDGTGHSDGIGYKQVADATGSDYVAFNTNQAQSSTFTWNNLDTFNLNGFTVAGAWGSQTLTINGYNGVNLINTIDFGITTQAIDFIANWVDLTSFSILTGNDYIKSSMHSGDGQHWAINDVIVNEAVQSVPEPLSITLLGLGLVGLGFSVTKKRAK